MPQLDSAKGGPRKKNKSVSRGRKHRASSTRKPAVAPVEVPDIPPPPVGRMERTRRLILAALRVWELKRKLNE